MEENLKTALDALTLSQTERLLDQNMPMKISPRTMRRIKSSVRHRIDCEHGRNTYLPKKLVACAATLIILLISLFVVGLDNVNAAIAKVFSFIPGYAIVENNESIEYILSQPVSAENDEVKFSLSNAIATKSQITVMFTLERKNLDEQQLLKEKQYEMEKLKNGGSLAHPNVILYASNRKIVKYSGSTGGSGKSDTSTFSYTLPPEEIGTNQTYKLEYADYGLSLEFKLKQYDSYYTLEEIGSTGYQNDISITAVPTFFDKQVQVDLYAINKSGYTLYSFHKDFEAYQNNDLHLITNSGTKTYTIPDGYSGVNGRFIFDIEPDDKDFTLVIPYITVKSNESKNVAIEIPKTGEKLKLNQKIEFKDCTMTIVDVQKTPSQHIGEKDCEELKMKLQYKNKLNHTVMSYPDFFKANYFGNAKSGGAWALEPDENGGISTTVYYALDKNESGKLRLNICNPRYYLTDEYRLQFSRP